MSGQGELATALSMLKTHMAKLTTTMTASPSGDPVVDDLTMKLNNLMPTLMTQLETMVSSLQTTSQTSTQTSSQSTPAYIMSPSSYGSFSSNPINWAACSICGSSTPASTGLCATCSSY
uniref:Uncharacterized protein n=1 Tax=viral metagenome TaxID=1070528 RepID=A0A6C0DH38_9ZZZZ